MFFSKSLLALVSAAAVAQAGTVTFWTLDNATRTIHFVSNGDENVMDPVTVSSAEKHKVTFPDSFVGNFYAVKQGETSDGNGMLGEVRFGGEYGMTYFDVSAIVNANDKDNVKQLFPASSHSPMSGCEVFPCNNAYYLPDDVQTKVTDEDDLIATLGSGSTGLF